MKFSLLDEIRSGSFEYTYYQAPELSEYEQARVKMVEDALLETLDEYQRALFEEYQERHLGGECEVHAFKFRVDFRYGLLAALEALGVELIGGEESEGNSALKSYDEARWRKIMELKEKRKAVKKKAESVNSTKKDKAVR